MPVYCVQIRRQRGILLAVFWIIQLLAGSAAAEGRAPGVAAKLMPRSHQDAVAQNGGRPENFASDQSAEEPRIDYDIYARLIPGARRVDGRSRITIHNTSRRTLGSLDLHLYLNAFKNNRSLFNSAFSRARSGSKSSGPWGFTRIDSFKRASTGDQLVHLLKQQGQDETDVHLDLITPIERKQSAVFEVKFTSQLPPLTDRTGFAGDFFFVGQWFPKIAKLESSGVSEHFSFHPHAEFYANFGAYSLVLDTPDQYIVGASGAPTACEHSPSLPPAPPQDGATRNCYEAKDVHDIAWTAWPHFVEHLQELEGVQVRLLLPPGHPWTAETTIKALRHGLGFFAKAYFPYPYSHLTVVHPPASAPGAGGMEYPTLITTGGHWLTPLVSRGIEIVTLHELAHQWFYGMIATNEPRWPFLDEGLTSHAELRAIEALYPDATSAAQLFGLKLDQFGFMRALAHERGSKFPLSTRAADFPSLAHLAAVAYQRSALLLRTLENVYGVAAVGQATRQYATTQRFRSPKPVALVAALRSFVGEAAATNFSLALKEAARVEYSIESFTSRLIPGDRGLFTDTREVIANAESMQYEAHLVALRDGNLAFDTEVDFGHEDGNIVTYPWPAERKTLVVNHRSRTPVLSVHIDPARKIAVEDNPLDNRLTAEAPKSLPLNLRLIAYVATFLQWIEP